MLTLAGLFLGCALQVVKSREYFREANLNDDYSGLERDAQKVNFPDKFDHYNSEEDDDDDDTEGDNDDDDLDIEVKAADAFDDDDDDENDEELGEYDSDVQEDPHPRPGWFRKIFRGRKLKKALGKIASKIRIRYQKRF